MINVTETAVSEVKKFMSAEGMEAASAGLRVRVLPGGCSGYQYALDVEDSPTQSDKVIESNGLKLFVDSFSLQLLDGVEIDYVSTVMGLVLHLRIQILLVVVVVVVLLVFSFSFSS